MDEFYAYEMIDVTQIAPFVFISRNIINPGDTPLATGMAYDGITTSNILNFLHGVWEVINIENLSTRSIHTKIMQEIIVIGDTLLDCSVTLASEIIEFVDSVFRAYFAREEVISYNGDDPDKPGYDEYGISHTWEHIDEYGHMIISSIKEWGRFIINNIVYKTDTTCKTIPEIYIAEETIWTENSPEVDKEP